MNPAFDNALCRQVESVPELIRSLYPDIEPKARYILTTPQIYSVKKVVLTGSGDCWCAALAAKRLFEKFLQIPVDVVSPLDLARHYQMKWVGESPCDPLVIAMSVSGRAARIVEAATRIHEHKALVIAVTGNADSPLAKAADQVLELNIPAFGFAPGARSYAVMLMACCLLAIRFGEVRLKYPMDQANAYRKELLRFMNCLEQRLPDWKQAALDYAERFRNAHSCEMVGSGYSYGSAWYAHEKMYEAAGVPANCTDGENWFHVNYFLRDISDVLTMVFAERQANTASRDRELVRRLGSMGRDFALVTDDPALEAPCRFLLPETEFGFLSPFLEWAPAALTAACLASLRGETYSRGFEGIWKEGPDDPSTVNSEIQIFD